MGRSMVNSGSQRQVVLAVVWLAATALLIVSLQTFGINQAFGDDGLPAAATIAVEYPLTPPETEESDHPSALYAGLQWAVLDTRITPADGFLGRARVDLDLTITNTLRLTTLRASENELSLVAADGNAVTETRFEDAPSRMAIAPGETARVSVGFDVGFTANPDPAALSLRIAEPSRTPALIPLAGQPDDAPAPILAAVDTEPAALADPDHDGRQIVVNPTGARIDVNAGPIRALDGQRVAVVKVNLQRASVKEDSTFLTPDFWSLQSSAGAVAPVLVAKGQETASNANEVTLVFAFPAEATDLNVVAAPQAEVARFPLVLPVAG
ncbi:MAG: hypothetical protein OEW17_11775 [Gemmatimonadota bacterium]|nr:hypothetical protein [Gemmatimonadota bacterium]